MRIDRLNRLFSIILISSVFMMFFSISCCKADQSLERPELFVPNPDDIRGKTAISPDGTLLAVSGTTVKLWKIPEGRFVRRFEGEGGGGLVKPAFSPDGNLLAAGGPVGTVKLWRISDGSLIRTFQASSDNTRSVVFSPDGKLLASGGIEKLYERNVIKIWQLSDGKLLRTFDDGKGFVEALAFSNDSRMLVSGSGFKEFAIKFWQVADGKLLRVLKTRPELSTSCLAFSSDDKLLVSGGGNQVSGIVKIWRVSDGRLEKELQGLKSEAEAAEFSSDGKIILAVDGSRNIKGWRISDGSLVKSFELPKSPDWFKASAALDIKRNYFTVFNQNSIEVRHLSDGRLIGNLQIEQSGIDRIIGASDNFEIRVGGIDSIKFIRNDAILGTGRYDGVIDIWNIAEGRKEKTLNTGNKRVTNDSPKRAVAFSPGGHVAAGNEEGTIRIWQIPDGKLLKTIKGHNNTVESLSFHPDGSLLASSSKGDGLKLWSVPEGAPIKITEGQGCKASGIVFSSDGNLMAANCKKYFNPTDEYPEDTIKIWRQFSAKPFISILLGAGEGDRGRCISFTPDDKSLAEISGAEWTDNISQYKIDSGKKIKIFNEGGGPIISFSFSPDGSHLLSTGMVKGKNNSRFIGLNFWRTSDSKLAHNLVNQNAEHLAISAKGDRLATGYNELTLWKLGKEPSQIEAIGNLLRLPGDEWVIYTPDGYYTSSVEGSGLLGWTFGKEPFSFEQFESDFKRADIIKARFNGDLNAGKPAPPITRPPYIELPEHLTTVESNEKSYALKLTASAIDKVKTLRVFVNGKAVSDLPVNAREKEISLSVPLFPGANRITAVAYNEKGFSSNPKYVDVICNRPDLPKPNLYALGIGVSKYSRLPQEWQLSYAHTDAKAVVEAFKKQEGKLFGQVNTKLLTNQEANVAAISDVLESLSGMSENDIAVIFLAGHGIMGKDGIFYYLTSDGSLVEPEKGGLSWKVLNERLSKIKGRVIMLLDACHSGNISTETVVPNSELAHKLASEGRSGVMVFAASKGRQSALESPDLGGGFGAFAYAVTQALGPKSKEADLNGNGFVEFMELVEYVGRSVDKETEGEQTPWLSRKELFGDLAMATVSGAKK